MLGSNLPMLVRSILDATIVDAHSAHKHAVQWKLSPEQELFEELLSNGWFEESGKFVLDPFWISTLSQRGRTCSETECISRLIVPAMLKELRAGKGKLCEYMREAKSMLARRQPTRFTQNIDYVEKHFWVNN